MSAGGKGHAQRPQFADDAEVTANWARMAGHADGCTRTKEWTPASTCCAGRSHADLEERTA